MLLNMWGNFKSMINIKKTHQQQLLDFNGDHEIMRLQGFIGCLREEKRAT
jgi:hypothetical protein